MARRADPVAAAEGAVALSERDLLALLGKIADELDVLNPRIEALWRARRICYHALRNFDPPPILAELAAAARVSEVSVITALKKPDPLEP